MQLSFTTHQSVNHRPTIDTEYENTAVSNNHIAAATDNSASQTIEG